MRPLLVLTLVLAATAAAERPKVPPPENGIVNGKVGLLAWPATLREDGHPGEYLPLTGCKVLLARWNEPEKRAAYPCGEWFFPAVPERYYEWLEQGDTISGQGQLLATGKGTGGPVTYPMVPAGYIALRENHGLRDDVVVRYIHLTRMWRAFTRTELGSAAHVPVRIQPGPVVGVVLDRKTRDAVALIRRTEVAAGKTTRVSAERPANGLAALFADLTAAHGPRKEPLTLALQIGGKAFAPDAFIESGRRVHGIWYGVPAGTAKLVVTSDKVTYNGPDLTLRPNRISTLRAELPLKPSLGVSVNMHGEAKPPEMFVHVFRAGDSQALRRERVQPGEPLQIESLDPAPYRVVLEVAPWRFPRNADLSDGTDGNVVWDLAPLEVRGTVRVGKTPARAHVTFLNDGSDWISVATDDAGAYATMLWLPRDYIVRVHAEGQSAPFTELIAVEESGTFDFILPATRYLARVTNAATGHPVAGARVVLNNQWESERAGRQNVVQDVTTDEKGEAILPPLRSGTVELSASAKGFRDAEAVTRKVEADGAETVAFALRPEEETHALRILLPDGAPAAKAELLATPANGDDVLWRGEAADDGAVAMPKLPANALLLVRHPQAASAARLFNDNNTVWQLAPPHLPRTLRVERAPGEAARTARLMLWLGDVRLRGLSLAFVTWSSAGPDREGLWTAHNLPRAPIRVLAWQKSDPRAVLSGAFDALAAEWPDPPPAQWTLRAID